MSKRDLIKQELKDLYKEGVELAQKFQKDKEPDFNYKYQAWYTKSLRAVEFLALDRLAEFRAYYQIDPKRKEFGYGSYVVQDFLMGVRPASFALQDFDTRKEALKCFLNQLTILHATNTRVDSVLANIESELYAELQDSELVISRQLTKISPRAAGALVGVLIEGHLQKVADAHQVKVAKKNPTIADLNDPLKAAGVVDTPAWRKIPYLADLRNLCSHKKDVDPTKEQVEELIAGAEWLTKNVF